MERFATMRILFDSKGNHYIHSFHRQEDNPSRRYRHHAKNRKNIIRNHQMRPTKEGM